jgi:hypothetical protein
MWPVVVLPGAMQMPLAAATGLMSLGVAMLHRSFQNLMYGILNTGTR